MSGMIVWSSGAISSPWQGPLVNPVFNSIITRDDTIDDLLKFMQECCAKLTSIGLANETMNMQMLAILRSLFKKCEKQEGKLNNLYSAIRDIRKEQLRGRRNLNQ